MTKAVSHGMVQAVPHGMVQAVPHGMVQADFTEWCRHFVVYFVFNEKVHFTYIKIIPFTLYNKL